jgi:hypothetical protein
MAHGKDTRTCRMPTTRAMPHASRLTRAAVRNTPYATRHMHPILPVRTSRLGARQLPVGLSISLILPQEAKQLTRKKKRRRKRRRGSDLGCRSNGRNSIMPSWAAAAGAVAPQAMH